MVASQQLDEFVQVPEGRIHYVKIGSGPPLVIFHGGGSSSLSWIPAMELMAKAFTCYAFDILGHGDSEEPPRESFSIPDHGRTMNQAMDSLGIKRAHVLGNLSGASLAIEMAASYPEKVDKLVLAVPSVIDPRTTPEQVKATAVLFSEGGGGGGQRRGEHESRRPLLRPQARVRGPAKRLSGQGRKVDSSPFRYQCMV